MSDTKTVTMQLSSLSDTARLGAIIAHAAPPGTTIGFTGTLGSGKTRLIQAIAAGSGVDESTVTSPTYVLCHIYHGSRLIYHLDAYRLRDTDEFLELGVDEMFASGALTLVEWADRVQDVLPAVRIDIDLEITAPDARLVTLVGPDRYLPILSQIEKVWDLGPS